jgi:hypothetical protein
MPFTEIIQAGPIMNRRAATTAVELPRTVIKASSFLPRLIDRQAVLTREMDYDLRVVDHRQARAC